MSRIGKAYEARFRSLLLRLRAQKLEAGVSLLVERARQRSGQPGASLTLALGKVYEQLRTQVRRWEIRTGRATSRPSREPVRFLCDAGLGGLARWLRASGYEAFWFPDIEDNALLREAQRLKAVLLTTDSLLMERGILRDEILPALWLPPALTKFEQLALVFREFDLTVLAPRCMSCGGELRRADKESERARIPPKTWRWLDEYSVCEQCGKLFWRGTHWRRIGQELVKRSGNLQAGL